MGEALLDLRLSCDFATGAALLDLRLSCDFATG